MTAPPPAAFEQTVLPHLDAAHNLARWLVRDAALAEDVVQDAIVRAIGYYATYRGGDARAWLLRIVRNTAYTTLAARRRITAGHDDTGLDADAAHEIPDPAYNPEATLHHRQRGARLDQALAALPPDLRECLVLRELEELSYKQIAFITGAPIGTVMSRLWRARRALVSEPGGQGEGAIT